MLLVTVSDDRFGRKESKYAETQRKIQRLFEKNPQFGVDKFLMLTWDDIIQAPFYEAAKTLLDNIDPARNGRVYKPYAIARGLNSILDGEFLIYSDCSPEIWNKKPYSLDKQYFDLDIAKNLCVQNGGILSALVKWDTRNIPDGLYGAHTHANFTTDRCMKKMGLERFANSLMPASGMIIIQKTYKTWCFVAEWLKWNCDAECSALGKPEIPNDWSYWDFSEEYTKMGHRHDQSIFGLLISRDNYKLVIPPDQLAGLSIHSPFQYCRPDVEYKFMDPNDNPDTERRIRKGDIVVNAKGLELQVFEIRPEEGIEWLIVGQHRESCYRTTADLIALKQ